MKNPWCTVPLKDYEAHMGLDAVAQLQALNRLMKSQFEAYPAKRIAVLGVAGGNGLEHIPPGTEKIYAIDVNRDYLNVCSERFQTSMGNRLDGEKIWQNVSPHTARKIYAVQEYHKCGSLRRVQGLLNHGDEAVTMLYAMADVITRRGRNGHKRTGRD